MKTAVKALADNKKKVTITVDAADVDKRIAQTYKDFAYKYNFPGFRKGKAPRPVIDNALGPQAVCATVTGDLFDDVFPLALDENDIIPMAQLEYEDEDKMVEPGKAFTLTATVECAPEFELSSYDPVTISLPAEGASDYEIDAQIEELLTFYYDFKDMAAGAKIKENGYAEIAMKATDSTGADMPALNTDSRLYELGSGVFPAELDAALVGMKKGDKKTVEIELSPDSSGLMAGNQAGGKVKFDIEVKCVKDKVLPELNDEWVKEKAGFESVDELRSRIADNITQQKEEAMPRWRENEALYALADRLNDEVPESMCNQEEQSLLQTFFRQVQEQGITFDAYLRQNGMTQDQFKEDLKRQAHDVVQQDLALDAWARHAGITVSEAELTAEFEQSGAEDPKKLQEEWRKKGQLSLLRQGMRRTKAIEAIMDSLVVNTMNPGEDDEKKSTTKKTAEKKPAAKKTTAKKPAAKKTTAEKKSPTKKPAAKKTTAKKMTAKKTGGE